MSEIPSKPPRSGLREIAVSGDTRPQLNLSKKTIGVDYNKDKIDPSILKAFKENPYTKPLDSYSFATKVKGVQQPEPEEPKEDPDDNFDKLLEALTYD